MLKLVRHSITFGLLFALLRGERQSIMALLLVPLLTVTMSGSPMSVIENEVQPGVFSSIPVAMWWAIQTLTTVGFLDRLKIYRQHHRKTTVMVAGKAIVIAQNLSANARSALGSIPNMAVTWRSGLRSSLVFVRIVAEPFLRQCRMTKPVTHR